MKHHLILTGLLGMALALAACGINIGSSLTTVRGSGDIVTAERDVSGFSSIQINIGADLVLAQGDEEGLIIEADDNLMAYIETEVRDNKLIVSTPDNTSISPSGIIRLNLTFDTLNAIDIFGSSAVTGENLDLATLAINFAGSGSTALTGRVDEQRINIRGTATINNFDLTCASAMVDISGSGTVEVNAERSLNVTVAGSGEIRYLGDPTLTQNVSGTANITHTS